FAGMPEYPLSTDYLVDRGIAHEKDIADCIAEGEDLPSMVVMSTISPPSIPSMADCGIGRKREVCSVDHPRATPQLSAIPLVALFEPPESRVGHGLSCACVRPPLYCTVCRR